MSRKMLRFRVMINDQRTTCYVQGDPVAVQAGRLGVGALGTPYVDFWVDSPDAEDPDQDRARSFQVYGTGHPVPKNARYWGTAERTVDGFVWHLFEHLEPDQEGHDGTHRPD